MTYKREPIGLKILAVHMRDTTPLEPSHKPSFAWWFGQTLLLIGIVCVGLSLMFLVE